MVVVENLIYYALRIKKVLLIISVRNVKGSICLIIEDLEENI